MSGNMKAIVMLVLPMLLLGSIVMLNETEGEPSRTNLPVLWSGNVYPASGYSDTLFNFTIWYADLDNDAPINMTLWVDSTSYLMSVAPGNGTDYTRGAQFMYLEKFDAGTHNYHVIVENANDTVRWPSSGNHTFTVIHRSPELFDFFHDPIRPTADDTIHFNITYRNPAGYAPLSVVFFLSHGGLTQSHNMTVSTGNYTTGVACTLDIQLAAGYYEFSIRARNDPLHVVYYPSGANQSFLVTNGTTPTDHAPSLYGEAYSPSSPGHGDFVYFSVYYRDIDGDPPVGMYLEMVDQNGTFLPAYNLSLDDHDFANGTLAYTGFSLGTGTYTFWFSTIYYNSTTRKYHKISTSNTTFRVSPPPSYPSLSNHQVNPSKPVAMSLVNFTVQYNDPLNGREDPVVMMFMWDSDGFDPTIYQYNMTRNGNRYSDGVTYYCTHTLAAGNYSYSYGYLVYNGTFMYPIYSNLSIHVTPKQVVKDNPPVLYWNDASISGNNVTFTVHYKDVDGDAPHSVVVNFVDRNKTYNSLAIHNMTIRGSDYKNGVVATVTVHLPAGTYYYRFETTSKGISGWSSASIPVNISTYLTVTVRSPPPPTNSAPVLYSSSVSPSTPVVGTLVNFTIHYRDADGDYPSFVKLWISSGTSRAVSHQMNVARGNYTSGVIAHKFMNLSAGTYSYYFQTSSGTHTVVHPARGSLSLTVSTRSVIPDDNRTPNGTAMFTLDPVSGEVSMDIQEIDEGLFLEYQGIDDGVVSVRLRSDEVVDRYVSFVIDEKVLGSGGEFVLILDGEVIATMTLDDLLAYTGDETRYHVEYSDGEYRIDLFIPDADDHNIEASLKKDEEKDPFPWLLILTIVGVIGIIIILGAFLLSKAQEKKKQEEFYRDFDLDLDDDMEDRGVLKGSLDDEMDWDDLLE